VIYASDLRHLERAQRSASKSTHRVRVGAVVASSAKRFGSGHNRQKNSPRVSHRHASVHAEIDALRSLERNGVDPFGATVYVVRLGRNSEHRPSYPCPQCEHALRVSGVRRIVCTDANSRIREYLLR
jgi:tRNA(Arg) A34 adenosine deaminase TadA